MIEIDRYKIYESHGYKFKNFVCLTDEEKRMVLEWRNSPEIRKWMINSGEISLENHLAFIDGLRTRSDCYYWLVYKPDGVPIGVFDITKIDRGNNLTECGDYAKPKKFDDGFYFLRECLYFYFNILEIEKNYTEAAVDNRNIHMLNTFFGIEYNGEKEVIENGQISKYLTCDSFSRDIFNSKYQLEFRDFLQHIKIYKI